MPVFESQFTVKAPIQAVRDFHHDTSALKKLVPPPTIIQLHEIQPLAEGSVSKFTLWIGPVPIHWTAKHHSVDENGFTDIQAKGPVKHWEHRHTFEPLEANLTLVRDHIEFEHFNGLRGVLTRILFAKLNLRLMFAYRKFSTRRELRNSKDEPK